MLAFSREAPDQVSAGGFRLRIIAMGHWQPLRPSIRRILASVIKREVAMMHFREKALYDVILLPIKDQGGAAYRGSFVYCYPDPTEANSGEWGNTFAHEIFHFWNYTRLRGADYASSQWFQEGFT